MTFGNDKVAERHGAPTVEALAAVETAEQFTDCLQQLRLANGNKSYKVIEQLSARMQRPVPHTPLNNVMRGVSPMSDQLLRNFLAVMGVRAPAVVEAWFAALNRISEQSPEDRPPRRYADKLTGPVAARDFFVEEDDVREVGRAIEEATDEVWLLGTTLSMHIDYVQDHLRAALARNCSVRILLIKPEGSAIDMSVLRAGPTGHDRSKMQWTLNKNLTLLRGLANEDAALEVRLFDYLAPYTLYAYDPERANGKMEMRLSSFHGKHDLRPTFQVTRSRDEDWFNYFHKQLHAMWNAADPYDLLG